MLIRLHKFVKICRTTISFDFMRRVQRRVSLEAEILFARLGYRLKAILPDYENHGVFSTTDPSRDNLTEIQSLDGRSVFFFDADSRNAIVALFPEVDVNAPQRIVAEADRICEHVFDLLGSGNTQLGTDIDWHTDFKSGYRWNPRTHYRRIRPAPYPGGYDIKVPWELNRFQHLVRLGQAYWITGAEKYAAEYVAQVEGWIDSNPWPWGVNWASTMDVAIRAVNWIWGYRFFRSSARLTPEFRLKSRRSLFLHGRHIFQNLDNKGPFTGNHYLSNLVGLIYLGILCPEFSDAGQWREFGLRELESEMFKQVLPDGVDFETSTGYHRLVTELFLSATLLAQLNGHSFGPPYMERLEKMFEFIMYLSKPDGTSPQFGDADNGRLHRLSIYDPAEREWVDYRYLLAVGAILFERQDFAHFAGDQWLDAFWLYGDRALRFKNSLDETPPSIPQLHSRSFTYAGIHVLRDKDMYLAMDAGTVGQNGNGGHAHRDTLSIEYFCNGQTWIVDPGTFVYTADYEARQRFRSLSYHNTVQVQQEDDTSPHQLRLFQLAEESPPSVLRWSTTTALDSLDVACHNFATVEGFDVTRRIRFDKATRSVLIHDCVAGAANFELGWKWHFPPKIHLKIVPGKGALASSPSGATLWVIPAESSNVEISIDEYEVSPSYGIRISAKRLVGRYCGTAKTAALAWIIAANWSPSLMDGIRNVDDISD